MLGTRRICRYSAAIVPILAALATCQVSETWSKRYNGPGGGTDNANAVAIDKEGNVYITGSSLSGGVGTEDYATLKYSSSGSLLWTRRYNGPGGTVDVANAIAASPSGHVYVTGRSRGSTSNDDYLTIKYTPDGDTVWVRRFNGPRNGKDIAYAIAADSSGNVYVVGESEGMVSTHGLFEDFLVIKYDSTGDTAWARRYNGPASDYDKAIAIAVDTVGNAYVTGVSDGGSSASGSTFFDYATVKYDRAGSFKWAARFNGAGSGNDEPKAIAVDDSGNVYVSGISTGSGADKDYATVRYSSSGDQQWLSTYNGPGNSVDEPSALALDASGNVLVTGRSWGGSGTKHDCATIKYTPRGDTVWTRRFNGIAGDNDEATCLALDSFGNVYVSGFSVATATSQDYVTLKYTPIGVHEWTVKYSNGDAAGGSDIVHAIAVDHSANVYVCGMSSLDYATVKYTQGLTRARDRGAVHPEMRLLPIVGNKVSAEYDLTGRKLSAIGWRVSGGTCYGKTSFRSRRSWVR